MSTDVRRAIETVWRIESARLIAGLARITRDVGLAEELALGVVASHRLRGFARPGAFPYDVG